MDTINTAGETCLFFFQIASSLPYNYMNLLYIVKFIVKIIKNVSCKPFPICSQLRIGNFTSVWFKRTLYHPWSKTHVSFGMFNIPSSYRRFDSLPLFVVLISKLNVVQTVPNIAFTDFW